MSGDDYDVIFRRLFDGALSEDEFQNLNQALRDSDELRRRYLRYAEVEGLLEESLGATPELAPVVPANRQRYALAGLLGVVGGMAALFLIFWSLGNVELPLFVPSELHGQRDVAVVIDWDVAPEDPADRANLPGGMLLKPGKLSLATGVLGLAFNGGALLQVEGPAELHLLGENEATLLSGRVTVQVDNSYSRFVLNSPQTSLVNHKSRYTLQADAGESVVDVFEGELFASQLGEDGYTYTSQGVTQAQRLRATKSSIEMSDLPLVDDLANFPETDLIRDLRITPRYVELVKAAKPEVYLRFQESGAGVARNDISEKYSAVPVATKDGADIQLGDAMASFSRDTGSSRALTSVDSLDGIMDGDFAIEFWVRVRGDSRQSIFSFVSETESWNHGVLFEYVDDGTSLVHPRHSFRFLYRNPVWHRGGVNVFTRGGIQRDVWQHLVGTVSNGYASVYHNGQLACRSYIGEHQPAGAMRFYVGQLRLAKFVDSLGGDIKVPEFVNLKDTRKLLGDVAELAIYSHSLTAMEVREHYHAVSSVDLMAAKTNQPSIPVASANHALRQVKVLAALP